MARRFRRTRRGITAGFEPQEAELVARLLDDVADLLAGPAGTDADPAPSGAAAGAPGGAVPTADDDALAALARQLGGGPVDAPADPALARLLPSASRDDDEAAAEFRRFTQAGLADRKRSVLRATAATLRRPPPLVLSEEEARGWVTALTDVRLVLAQRLGLESDEDAALVAQRAAEADEDDPAAWTASIYDFLTWLQEGLAEVLLRDLPARGGPPRR